MLYECKTWSLILREECRIRDLETGSCGEYLGSRGMQMESAECSTIGEFHSFYRSSNIVRVINSIR